MQVLDEVTHSKSMMLRVRECRESTQDEWAIGKIYSLLNKGKQITFKSILCFESPHFSMPFC